MSSASFFPPDANMLRSPKEAVNTFSQAGGFPKQRHVFLVRFISPVIPFLETAKTTANELTFVVKSVERPRVSTKTEELNQYNKKRQVITGYRLEPIRLQFWDSADGAALTMWMRYAAYYFGDLNNQVGNPGESGTGNPAYSYDITTNNFNDPGTGFGFTARNNGSTNPDDQWFFDRIEIYHFYDQVYDLYYLIHPRFAAFEPDDLDYENSGVSLISASLAYENLQYFPQQPVANTSFYEFQDSFFSDVISVPDTPFPKANTTSFNNFTQSNPPIGNLLSPIAGAYGPVADFRFVSPSSTGALGIYGNFSFGPGGPRGNVGVSLSTMSLGNPALAAALSTGYGPDLSSPNSVMTNSAVGAYRGIDGALYDATAAQIAGAASGYGTAGSAITTGMLASQAMGGGTLAVNNAGQIVLAPTTYGAINVQQTGTAQYGYNPQTAPDGSSWGYNGPDGFQGPNNGAQQQGPYLPDQPAGLDSRFVSSEPLAPPSYGQ